VTSPALPHVVRSDVERVSPVQTAAAAEATAGLQTFAHRLLSEHPELFAGPNAVVSAAPSREVVELSLPKWDFRSDVRLTEVLPAMGMPKAFTEAAEFSGIADSELMIDEVIHRADVTVDEEGTEAAAVTGIGMRISGLPPSPKASLVADRPFAFVVLHDATGSPLFEGVVGDPAATR
jgi:serine protease inhibitor